MKLPFTPAEYRKGISCILGFIVEGISLGLFHGTALAVATGIVGVATSAGVIGVPNQRPATVKIAP